MNQAKFFNEITLAAPAEKLGEVALMMGLIPSFIVRHFPDGWQFYIPDETAQQLTPEAACLKLKQLVDYRIAGMATIGIGTVNRAGAANVVLTNLVGFHLDDLQTQWLQTSRDPPELRISQHLEQENQTINK